MPRLSIRQIDEDTLYQPFFFSVSGFGGGELGGVLGRTLWITLELIPS